MGFTPLLKKQNFNLVTEGEISQAVPNFLKQYYFHMKQPIYQITHITCYSSQQIQGQYQEIHHPDLFLR